MRLVRVFSALLLFGASAGWASDKLPVENNTYGTAGLTWVTLTTWDFHPVNSSTTYNVGTFPNFGIYNTGATFGEYAAGLHLPEGAVVSISELAACDTNTTLNLDAYFETTPKAGGPVSVFGQASTTGSGGCQVVSNTVPLTPFTINNDTTEYFIAVTFNSNADTTLLLNSVRVGYKLQISPDPSTATFTDVPVGHPFHRFVEALYASGITGGCGGGNYCPDAPVTRGQMAVFLAGALGLHWAP
jgi:hypothetical protein